jgi:hypothetical protein
MNTALVLIVALTSAGAGVLAARRWQSLDSSEGGSGGGVASWVIRSLIISAAVVLAMRGYLVIDGIVQTGDGTTAGDVIVPGLPEMLIDPGILVGLAVIIHAIANRAPQE